MYAAGNPKTKKALKESIARGKRIRAFQPGGMFPGATEGWVTIEGPHYPQPHRWYARARLENSIIIEVK